MQYISKVTEQLFFGKYPCEEVLQACITLQIKTIVDLTHSEDHLTPYHVPEGMTRICFPIPDMSTAKDNATVTFISTLVESSKQGAMYIHCLGGHGRSGLIMSLLYGRLFAKNGEESLAVIKESHSKRQTMHPKMRKLGSPQTKAQKKQVIKLLNL
jgi:protein-tyrosine phosphatase